MGMVEGAVGFGLDILIGPLKNDSIGVSFAKSTSDRPYPFGYAV
jgi:hypothetical protein